MKLLVSENKDSGTKLKLEPRDYLETSLAVYKTSICIRVPGRMSDYGQEPSSAVTKMETTVLNLWVEKSTGI